MSTDPWFPFAPERDAARVRLFCFPHAGGGASAYRTWGRELGEDVAVHAIQLPGREGRFAEPPLRRVDDLVQALLPPLRSRARPPFAFFGHSLGAIVAFEVTRELRRLGADLPVRLFVAGAGAPHVHNPNRPLHALPEAELYAELRRMGGTAPEVLASTDLMRYLLPMLRADFAMHELYELRQAEPLPVPLSVFGGEDDAQVDRIRLEAWRELTTAGCRLHRLRGGHFFVRTEQAALLDIVRRELVRD